MDEQIKDDTTIKTDFGSVDDSPPPRQDVPVENITGFFVTVSGTPAWVPKSLRESIAIDTSTARLWYYDPVNKQWRNVT